MTSSVMKWKIPISMLIVVFLIASFVWMAPRTYVPKPVGHTRNLHAVTSRDGNVERKDYVDDDGVIQTAGDVGYATVITTISEKNTLEQYYDEHGVPVKRYSGYYAILREYDDEGRNYHISYLGPDNKPIITSTGCSDIYRTFYDTGEIKTEKYYDLSGKPVCHPIYGYGCLNEYDANGKKVKITYLDDKDQPRRGGLGYAMITLSYHASDGQDNGKIKYEFYYDENNEPIAQSLGHYGVYKADYNLYGQNATLTYLDMNGQPMNTKRGYATVARTYYTDGARKTERYFDSDGNPYRMPDGQYGEKYENNQVVYLDINGNEQFSLRRLLYNHSYLVILSALLAVFISVLLNRRMNLLLAIVYCAAIGYMTLLFRENVSEYKNPAVIWNFQRISKMFFNAETRAGVLKNIWLFIPLGTILFRISPKKRMLLIPLLLSGTIEAVQLFTKTGYCDLIDLVSNGLGGVIGFKMAELLSEAAERIRRPKERSVHPA